MYIYNDKNLVKYELKLFISTIIDILEYIFEIAKAYWFL